MTQNSLRRIALSFAAASALMLITPLAAHAADGPAGKHRVVFQISDNDPQKWNLALNNAKNVADGLGADQTAMEIVVYGPGISMLKAESPVAQRIAKALKDGIAVVACENTMKAQKLGHGDMLPDIGYVPAGVVELMTKQSEGWAYIRP